MPVLAIALFIGVVAGLRAALPLAAISWAAYLGRLGLSDTHLAFMGSAWAPWVFSLLALGEIFNDKRASTPSRTVPPQFIGRIATGAFSGGAIGLSVNSLLAGIVLGAIGAIVGTLGGSVARGVLAKRFGRDLPAALMEDATAIGACIVLVRLMRS